jgi:hypothetical protein
MTTPTTTATPPGVETYLARVREQLADLPTSDRDDLLEDLHLHLIEVAAETGAELEEKLGPPDAYAAELRAAAGLPAAGRARRTAPVHDRARRLAAAAGHQPAVREVAAFVPSLQPAWWVLRGYLLVAGPAFLPARVGSTFPIPDVGGPAGGVALTAVAVVVSVWFGRNRRRWRAAMPLVIAANAAVVIVALVAAAHVRTDIDRRAEVAWGVPTAVPTPVAPSEYSPYLLSPNGRITNIYPYDSSGHPLTGVLLYDESGNPINLPDQPDISGNPLANHFPLAGDGSEIRNSYPVPQTVAPQDCAGPCPSSQVARPTVTPPPPSASPTPTTTPTATKRRAGNGH